MRRLLSLFAIVMVNLFLGYITCGLWFVYIIMKALCKRAGRTYIVTTKYYKK